MTHLRWILCALAGTTVLAGCSFWGVGGRTDPSFARVLQGDPRHDVASAHIFVANYINGKVLEFRLGATGDVRPQRKIGGPATGIVNPSSLGVDSAGDIYALLAPTKQYPAQIGVFTPNQRGDVKPVRTIIDALILHKPQRIAVDAAGDVFLLYLGRDKNYGIDEFQPGADGVLRPVREITGSNTLLDGPQTIVDLAADDSGGIWWTCDGTTGTPRVVGYAAGAHGDVAPTIDLEKGSVTEIQAPTELSVDASGYVYVQTPFDTDKAGVLVFAPGATGPVAPIRKIRFNGDFTLGTVYGGILVALGVVNTNEAAIGTFDAHKPGIQNPKALITGAHTDLMKPKDPEVR